MMGDTPEEIEGPVRQVRAESAENGSDISSFKLAISSAKAVHIMHGLMISGIELALTLGNALSQDAFRPNSLSDVIFGGSAVIEGVGFMYAIVTALEAILLSTPDDVISVGVPAMVLAEHMFLSDMEPEDDFFLYPALMLQSLCFSTYVTAMLILSPSSRPSLSTLTWSIAVGTIVAASYVSYKRYQANDSLPSLVRYFLVSVPFAVEVSESVLLFTTGPASFVAYLLAVLDLVIIAPGSLFLGTMLLSTVCSCC